jgi:hypothetical protein
VVASPKSEPWWVLWFWVCSWWVLAPKVFQPYTNQLVIWFVQVHVSDWLLIILPSFIPELQHAPLPPKCYKLRSVPQLFTLPLLSLQTHIWVYLGAWGASDRVGMKLGLLHACSPGWSGELMDHVWPCKMSYWLDNDGLSCLWLEIL